MSTRWSSPIELSAEEAALCNNLTKHRRFFRFLRLHRHTLFADGFEDELLALYSDAPRGTPPKAAAIFTLVTLLQAFTGVSDDDSRALGTGAEREEGEQRWWEWSRPAVTPDFEAHTSDFGLALERADEAASDLPPELDWTALPRWMRSVPEQGPPNEAEYQAGSGPDGRE